MSNDSLNVALITDVFFQDRPEERLCDRLKEAGDGGADLAVLPELGLNPWSPATRQARSQDAEKPEGPRHQMLSKAARQVGIGVLGGVILRDPATGKRHNTALVFDPNGELVHTYQKLHLPEEEGFWETSHYEAGTEPASLVSTFNLSFGVQICSDLNRPEGCHALGGLGAEAVLGPRATEKATYDRWKTVLRANAITSCLYVVSVNRPGPEAGVLIGGPSVAIAPSGQVLLETTDPVAVVTLEREAVKRARRLYPGYLPCRADIYTRAWRQAHENAGRRDV